MVGMAHAVSWCAMRIATAVGHTRPHLPVLLCLSGIIDALGITEDGLTV
jgi:hypothetical protein